MVDDAYALEVECFVTLEVLIAADLANTAAVTEAFFNVVNSNDAIKKLPIGSTLSLAMW